MNKIVQNIFFLTFALIYSVQSYAQAATENTRIDSPVVVSLQAAAVASAHPLATGVGIEILKQGGNAFDAAVAVSAALAVVEPYSSGIGGGGFYLLHQAKENKYVMLDAREKAPQQADKDMYLDQQSDVIADASITGALSAGIPGIPAALVELANKYGTLSLSQSLAPAIGYARSGFEVDAYYQRMAGFRLHALQMNGAASDIFLDADEVPAVGYLIVQKDLANTLEKIAESGIAGFYEGELAEKMVNDVRKHGGIWTMDDMAAYKVQQRAPDVVNYKEMKVVMASLPSSGGLVLSEIFKILATYDLQAMTKTQRIHHIVEAMRRAYRDRAEYMGDPDFIEVPAEYLVSDAHIQALANSISEKRATPSASLKAVAQPSGKGSDTTHFSIIDKQGNKVSATLSINYPFGACFVAEGTGVLLNDEMDDFVSKPGVPNVYGLVGSHANAIAPGKRMLSSMTPSFAETADRSVIIGTPGGSRIITMVLLGLLDFYDKRTADEIVNNGRFHHQYLPDEVSFEPDVFDSKQLDELHQLGHKTRALNSSYGNMQIIVSNKKTGELDAASDGRGVGRAQIWR
ncbi:MAG: gamma-glutamyltransferase [Gammaproteobacteria bacterium]|nr:gamma-glutamyltransferase [Gammaproteobacteria bacterium]